MKINDGKPPHNTRRVFRWADLPDTTEPALYRVTDPGKKQHIFTASKHKRQVLEALMNGPIFAASYCRISDKVLPLRRDHGVEIRCDLYRNDEETGRERYGVYVLVSKVERITRSEAGVAA